MEPCLLEQMLNLVLCSSTKVGKEWGLQGEVVMGQGRVMTGDGVN